MVFCRDEVTRLRAIVAIHDTTLGPGLGGIRMREYASDAEALTDVLRLSQAMSLKASLAGLDFGGGKAVISSNVKVAAAGASLDRGHRSAVFADWWPVKCGDRNPSGHNRSSIS